MSPAGIVTLAFVAGFVRDGLAVTPAVRKENREGGRE